MKIKGMKMKRRMERGMERGMKTRIKMKKTRLAFSCVCVYFFWKRRSFVVRDQVFHLPIINTILFVQFSQFNIFLIYAQKTMKKAVVVVATAAATAVAAAFSGSIADSIVEHAAIGRRKYAVHDWPQLLAARASSQPQPFRDELLCEV